ncbi:hypothetical protein BCU85_16535 [Vibrio lentus]|uniref:hypothetical protein n=1 Tax=Vibrio TaxID=662 RepID=UPI0007EEDBE7|nr:MULTISPECIES: hypothetical protein [Vibrio]MBS9920001.1 hypothetical protein [Vibrio alginolyticus]MCC4817057.1 hypothetical protein [Vibrio lentus]OBS98276.1 hypothetical protein A9259_07405 [Vibrio cyclitrophicus]PMG73397.1 hypothetical protein BCU85_16535 [Vibrio lentus]PMJ09326.1 hypothetical protein BCU31_19230 [Vibrio lentus]
MNKLLSGLIIMLMPLAISNISFSSNYGELNSTLDTLVVQQGLMIERTDVFLKDIESIKETSIQNGQRIESLEKLLID